MKQMNVTQIGILMDNHEEIWLDKQEISELNMNIQNETLTLCGGEFLSVKVIGSFDMQLHAAANHTYNSFGYPSSETIFRRLMNRSDASGIICRTLEYEETYCIPDGYCLFCKLDERGNLCVHMNSEEEIYGCCECCDCSD